MSSILFLCKSCSYSNMFIPVANPQRFTQDSHVRTSSGFLNSTSCPCVKLREDVFHYSSLFMCDYPGYYKTLSFFLHVVILCTVFACTLFLLMGWNCVYELCFTVFLFIYVLFACFCVLWVFWSLAFPHLTIYSKVSFSAGLQGNDTEDYCFDQ